MLTTQGIAVSRVVCGTGQRIAPETLLSSRSRNWNGVVVELRRARNIDFEIPYRDHVIGVVLAGGANLYQWRSGRSSRRTLHSGDVIITPAGEPKRWQHAQEALWIALRLASPYVERVAADECGLQAGQAHLLDNFGTRDVHIEEIALRMLKALEPEAGAARIYVESLTCQLAGHVLKNYSARSTQRVAERRLPALSQHKLRRMIEYVEAHLGDDLTLSSIATVLAMSPGHFAHAVRQTLGVPPHRYVLHRRIERAKSLLRHSDLPITQIAQRIGCRSPSSFSSLFHRTTGVTPRNYRDGEAGFSLTGSGAMSLQFTLSASRSPGRSSANRTRQG